MKNWITELCPEIAEWQAELIAEECEKAVATERERCAKVAEEFPHDQLGCLDEVAAAIRGQQ